MRTEDLYQIEMVDVNESEFLRRKQNIGITQKKHVNRVQNEKNVMDTFLVKILSLSPTVKKMSTLSMGSVERAHSGRVTSISDRFEDPDNPKVKKLKLYVRISVNLLLNMLKLPKLVKLPHLKIMYVHQDRN